MSTNESYWPVVIRWGVIGALILVAYTTIANMFGFSSPAGGWGMMILSSLLSIAISVFIARQAIVTQKTAQQGYITLGRAFAVAFFTLLIAGIVNLFYNYLYMTVIDPGYIDQMVEDIAVMYERMGMSEEQIEQAMEMGAGRMKPSTTLLWGFLGAPVSSAIFAIIMAAILKKDPPAETTILDSEQ
jgi:hypothetical protein